MVWLVGLLCASVHSCRPGQVKIAGEDDLCIDCPKGTYRRAGQKSCQLCPSGVYGLGGSRSSSCTAPCPAGRYGLKGSTSWKCTASCSSGRYSTAGAALCKVCPGGRFGSGAGSAKSTLCDGPCAAGTYSNPGFSLPLSADANANVRAWYDYDSLFAICCIKLLFSLFSLSCPPGKFSGQAQAICVAW
jgi:hypothetical protein